jgi:hypothetical protein
MKLDAENLHMAPLSNFVVNVGELESLLMKFCVFFLHFLLRFGGGGENKIDPIRAHKKLFVVGFVKLSAVKDIFWGVNTFLSALYKFIFRFG